MKSFFQNLFDTIKNWLQKLSFKTGLIILLLCIPFYLLSFIQMSFDISYTMKGTLWVIFFGMAKTFQYTGLLILGTEGIKRLKGWWSKFRKRKLVNEE